MVRPDAHRLIELQKLLLAFSHVERKLKRKHHDNFVHENDTEHSYNLAMTAWFLAKYFPELNDALLVKIALVHDLVEIHAGDTYAYADQTLLDTKPAREKEALEKLKHDWEDFPEMISHIEDYELRSSPEAKFIYALDKLMPIMIIYINDGLTWKEEGITVKMLHDVKEAKVALSPEIQPYYDQLRAILLDSPHIIPAK